MKYLKYMYKFGVTDLKEYLGNDIVDTLIEWFPNSDNLLTRERLITMIDSIHGMNILRNRKFRYDLLQSMSPKEIYTIRDYCLIGDERKDDNLTELVEIISSKPWNRNIVTSYLIKIWELPENIFDKEMDNTVTINHISSGERFYELLDYQYYIKQRVLNNLNSGNLQERMLIHMPTGTGKTKTSMHTIINYIEFSLEKKGLVIWIAHTIELLQQAFDTFVEVWEHLGEGNINAYKIWGNHAIDDFTEPLSGIAFCGLAKLLSIHDSNSALFDQLKRDCRLVVFDEAHKAAASKTQRVIESLLKMPDGYDNRALIGLTATPGRTTNKSYDNNLLTNMFGGKLISIDASILNQINMGKLRALNSLAEENIIKYFQERRILAKVRVDKLTYRTTFTEAEIKALESSLVDMGYSEKDFSEKQLKVFAVNKDRNRAIMEKLRELTIEKIPTIVFACSVDHAKMLSAMLSLEGIPNSLVLGEKNSFERRRAIDLFKDRNSNVDIIINYEVLTTGFDSKNIRCVFIARPTQSIVLYSQMLGRGLRGPLMGGNEECLLVDIDDNLNAFDSEMAFSHFDDYWKPGR